MNNTRTSKGCPSHVCDVNAVILLLVQRILVGSDRTEVIMAATLQHLPVADCSLSSNKSNNSIRSPMNRLHPVKPYKQFLIWVSMLSILAGFSLFCFKQYLIEPYRSFIWVRGVIQTQEPEPCIRREGPWKPMSRPNRF